MQSKPKSNSVVTTTRNEHVITFEVKGAGAVTLDMGKVSAPNSARFTYHGAIQRVSDAAARSRDTATGQPASPESKLAAMRRLVEHYESGSEDWSPARAESAGPGLDRTLLAAVCEATSKSEAEVREMVAAGAARKSLTQRAYLEALGTASTVKPIYERMRAAATPAIDADAELAAATGAGELAEATKG